MKNKSSIYIMCIIFLIIIFITIILLKNKPVSNFNNNILTSNVIETDIEISYSEEELNSEVVSTNVSYINLNNDNISTTGIGININKTTATITKAGSYYITGTLDNGQIIIETTKDDIVQLILKNANITCENSSPIYIKQASEVIITLEDESVNNITDGETYTSIVDDEPNATIFCKSDLTINGTGTLNVTSKYNDAIASKDGLKIISGTININSKDDGIRGKDYVAIKGGNIQITATGDGIKSTNTEDTEKGYVLIEKGKINIIADNDGIQAETGVIIKDGEINIKTGGGSQNSNNNNITWGRMNTEKGSTTTIETTSAKGIKAVNDIQIAGGKININSSDDSIHSNGLIKIENGELTLSSGDDGIHADSEIKIENGTINILKSYEGIESALITINDGKINIIASDDGINIAGGNDSSSMNERPGQNNFAMQTNSNYKLIINNGYIIVNANGDGLDSNGSIEMKNGTVIVNGPTNNGNGALDYNSTFNITGGTLIAVGSSGMMQAISNSSTQYCISAAFNNTQTAKNLIHIEDENGTEVVTFEPSKQYQSIVICSSKIEKGNTYNIYLGGSYEGENIDGVYTNGTYTKGTLNTTVTISSIVNSVGNRQNQMRF